MSLRYCSLFSGSNGNSALLASDSSHLLIDAGLSGKSLIKAMESVGQNPEGLKGILITHEHLDHIKGAGILSRRFNIPIYANAETWEAMEDTIGKIPIKNIRIFDNGSQFFIGNIEIVPFSISHDAANPVGFSFFYQGKRFAHVTDLGYVSKQVFEQIQGVDLLLIESNHDIPLLEASSYPRSLKNRILSNKGHLSNIDAAKLCINLAKKGTHQFILGHLSRENNSEKLAYQTVSLNMKKEGCQIGENADAQIYLAHQSATTEVFCLY